jgi:hypothetical protein
LPVPADDRLRLGDGQPGAPGAEAAAQRHPEQAVAQAEPRPRRRALEQGQLLAQGEVLGRQQGAADGAGAQKQETAGKETHADPFAERGR